MQCWHALIVEGDFAAYEDVEDYPERPDVNLGTGVDFGVQQLGSSEVEGPAERGEVGGRVPEIGQPKIDDLDIPGLGDQDVLDLQV